jgi:asparagine synthase (glutamine-hydrolysing)
MCGIAGLLATNTSHENAARILDAMTAALTHRGPDASGNWIDAEAGIGLGHRRLSILDLSPHGAQPMQSACGRYVISFNGEIYNFEQLRTELEGVTAWRGHSDTEVMLAAFTHWGLEKAVERFVGMFAFALWDRRERTLTLVRDRLGEKPLYYGWLGRSFVFGSELKALKHHPDWRGDIDRNALALLLRHNYIPAPYSIYKDINKLPPGTWLRIVANANGAEARFQPQAYWSARQAAEQGTRSPLEISETEAIASLDGLLRDSIRRQMVADVPVGAFLSGGFDSSTVVALMQAQSASRVKTFTIGFHEKAYDEAQHARAVASHLGTEHTELYVTPEEAMAVIPRLPAIYDEPFSDSSQIPTFLVSSLTRKHVTVSLSGDGGDELFGGYNRYFWGKSIWRRLRWAPVGLRRMLARAMTAVPPARWEALFNSLGPLLPSVLRQRNPGDKLHKLAEVVGVANAEALYLGLVSHWKDPAAVILSAEEPSTQLTDSSNWADLPDFTQRMMYLDTVSYLPDDILVKLDRASMAVSLESRVPLLDHRLVEFAWRLPLDLKMRGNTGKWLLRQVLYQYVPKALVDRPKMGFGVPLDSWLRGPLRPWAESLLDEKRLRDEGFFNPAPIRQKWLEHLSGRRNWQYPLWDILMFQAWMENESNYGIERGNAEAAFYC